MRRFLVALGLAPMLALAACSDNVVRAPESTGAGATGSGGGSATTGNGGSTGVGVPVEPAIAELRAPDQTSVHVTFNTDVAGLVPTTADALVITSAEVDPLAIELVTYDAAAHVLVITTERQKLGATYQLAISGAAEPLSGGEFIAADTARFWATDFATFEDYEIVADRVVVAEQSVIYIEQGQSDAGVAEAAQRFDEEIFPKETALLSAPSDVDDNGRIVLLGLDGADYYGGYFSPLNNMPDDEVFPQWGYHSNESDMLYINVAYAPFEAIHVLPHEFSHLLYHQQHGFQFTDWSWHNEGLAECAVHVVNGTNDYAVQVVVTDPFGQIAQGLSLVHWQYGNYTQYALAYMFWTYLAAQAGGVDAYGELFDASGAPGDIEAWAQAKLGKTFAEAQRDFMLGMWIQSPTGPHGFGALVDFFGAKPPVVPAGTGSVDLEPYAGAFFQLGVDSVDYPGTQGAHILYAGVDTAAVVDFEAPFAVGGGALLVLNTNPDAEQATKEKSGPDLFPVAAPPSPKQAKLTGRDRAWLHPPPFDPRNLDQLYAWRARTSGF
jgi:hypothetical protein